MAQGGYAFLLGIAAGSAGVDFLPGLGAGGICDAAFPPVMSVGVSVALDDVVDIINRVPFLDGDVFITIGNGDGIAAFQDEVIGAV